MKTTIRSIALAGTLLLGGSVHAQDKAPKSPEELAKGRAECYGQALGLKDKELTLLMSALTDGEQKVAEMRAAIAELQAQIEASLAESDAAAEANLTEAQLAKLAELRKTGWKPCSEPCAAPGAKASCEGKTDGKGACCAGGAKAAAPKTAAPAPKPNATMK
jgi:hypothetical protein